MNIETKIRNGLGILEELDNGGHLSLMNDLNDLRVPFALKDGVEARLDMNRGMILLNLRPNGFWPSDTVKVRWSRVDGNWHSEISHGSGGFDGTIPNIEAMKAMHSAIGQAIQIVEDTDLNSTYRYEGITS